MVIMSTRATEVSIQAVSPEFGRALLEDGFLVRSQSQAGVGAGGAPEQQRGRRGSAGGAGA